MTRLRLFLASRRELRAQIRNNESLINSLNHRFGVVVMERDALRQERDDLKAFVRCMSDTWTEVES